MRRLVLLGFASCCLLATGPATALARHHHHHARHHVRHHVRRFGALDAQPSQPTSPTTPSQTAGTIASFSGGVLTIMLNDKSTVSGTVTSDTEIECQGMGNDIARDGGPGSSGGDNGGDNSGDNSGDRGDGGDDQGENDQNGQACGMTALTPGTTVDGAELQLSGSGATWTKVELG